jgi:hypothetical protein
VVQQLDGEPGVAAGPGGLGPGQDGGRLGQGLGGGGKAGLPGQGGEDAAELGGGVAGEVDDGREPGGQCGGRGPACPAKMMTSSPLRLCLCSWVIAWIGQRSTC